MDCEIKQIKLVGGHVVELEFKDGQRGRVNLAGYAAKGGVFQRFSDLDYFKRVQVNPELGTLCWPDGVDIAPETLYAMATGRKPVPA